jgi:hypothetical protein
MHSELGLDQSYKADITRAVKLVTSKEVAEARKIGHLLVLAKISVHVRPKRSVAATRASMIPGSLIE